MLTSSRAARNNQDFTYTWTYIADPTASNTSLRQFVDIPSSWVDVRNTVLNISTSPPTDPKIKNDILDLVRSVPELDFDTAAWLYIRRCRAGRTKVPFNEFGLSTFFLFVLDCMGSPSWCGSGDTPPKSRESYYFESLLLLGYNLTAISSPTA